MQFTETLAAPGVGTPDGRMAATQVALLAHRLIALDDLWTLQLEAAGAGKDPAVLDERHERALRDLVDDMRATIEELRHRAPELRVMLNALSDETFRAALAAIAEAPGAPGDLLSMLDTQLGDYEPRGACIAACDYVEKHLSDEAGPLEEKYGRIRAGEFTPGDIRLPSRCAVILVLLGASVVSTLGLGGPPLFVGVAVAVNVGGAMIGWVDRKCPNTLAKITGGRR